MTYTLDMASELEPHVAQDGIQEVPLTKARALLTRLIEQVREDGLVSALTVRGRRRAYLVTPDAFEQAATDRCMVEGFQRAALDVPKDAPTEEFLRVMAGLVMEAEDRAAARRKAVADFHASD